MIRFCPRARLQLGRLLATGTATGTTGTAEISRDASHVRLGERVDELPTRVPRGRLVAAVRGLGGAQRGLCECVWLSVEG